MDIKTFRDAAGLTPAELARRSGVDLAIISRLENGKARSASFKTIVRLAAALNVSPEDLEPVATCRRQANA
jgi:transcriptional regulator with XRE-family HTH domain